MYGSGDRTTILDSVKIVQGESLYNAPASQVTIKTLTNGISSAGGIGNFEIVSNGAWNANLSIYKVNNTDIDNDSGTFSLDVGAETGTLTATGSYSPTNGIAGTHLIALELGPEPLYLRPSGPTGNGLIADYYGSLGIRYSLKIYARNADGTDGALRATGNIYQRDAYGGRTYVAPSTWDSTDNALLTASRAKSSWTFLTI